MENEIENKILKIVKSEMFLEDYQYVVDAMNDCDYCYNFEIVDEPTGNYQEDDRYWVEQSGGYSGDDYTGTLCFFISENRYLKFHYHC